MTYDLDLWPTDLNINRDHLLIKDCLPKKFEASETERSWFISCTRYGQSTWPLTLTFDLLTWISIGIIYLSSTYLGPTKYEACRTTHCWVISCTRYRRSTWPLTLTLAYWPEYREGSSTHQGLSTYQVWHFWGKVFLSYQFHKVKGDQHKIWLMAGPTDRQTDRHVQRNMPSFFKRGHKHQREVGQCLQQPNIKHQLRICQWLE